jgi:hypothetical protein
MYTFLNAFTSATYWIKTRMKSSYIFAIVAITCDSATSCNLTLFALASGDLVFPYAINGNPPSELQIEGTSHKVLDRGKSAITREHATITAWDSGKTHRARDSYLCSRFRDSPTTQKNHASASSSAVWLYIAPTHCSGR